MHARALLQLGCWMEEKALYGCDTVLKQYEVSTFVVVDGLCAPPAVLSLTALSLVSAMLRVPLADH